VILIKEKRGQKKSLQRRRSEWNAGGENFGRGGFVVIAGQKDNFLLFTGRVLREGL